MPDDLQRGARRGRPALLLTTVFLAGFLIYLPTAWHGWVFDDTLAVANQPLAKDPADLAGIFGSPYWAGVLPRANLYRPVTILSFALNHALTGPGPGGHHVTNAVLHGALAALVVLLALEWGLPALAAGAAGFLFAAHPMHVEAVAPVTGRSDLLGVGLMLAAWLSHLRAHPLRGAPPPARRRALLTAVSVTLYVAAVLSKENAAVLPALIFATDAALAARPRPWRRLRVTPVLMLAALGGVLALRAAVLPVPDASDARIFAFAHQGVMTRLLTAMAVLGRYLFLTVLPVTPTSDYGFAQIPFVTTPLDAGFLVSLAAYVAVAAAGFVLTWRGGVVGASILLYLGAIFPVSNLAFSTGTILGERLLLLPSAAACLIAGALVARTRGRVRRVALVAVGAAVLLMGGWTLSRSADWKDDLTLFRTLSRTSPDSARVWYGLGVLEAGEGNDTDAIDAYQRALSIRPAYPECQHNLGLLYLKQGDNQGAIEALRRAVQMDPGLPDVLNDLGVALERAGRWQRAASAYRAQIQRDPGDGRASANLGQLLLTHGRPGQAIPPLQRAIAADPADPKRHQFLAIALERLSRHDAAVEALDQAVAQSPEFAAGLIPFARLALELNLPALASAALARATARGETIPSDLAAALPPTQP